MSAEDNDEDDMPIMNFPAMIPSISLIETELSEPEEKVWDCKFTDKITWTRDHSGAQCLNEYTLGDELGHGSFGRVRMCERKDDSNVRKFAVKIMSKPRLRKIAEYVNSAGFMRKITAEDKVRREIEIMRKLYHRNVVLLFEVIESPDSDDDDSHICMVLELMEGPTMKCGDYEGVFVAESEDSGVWPEERAKVLFRDLCLGLQYLHSRGICHRDIKPDNLMIFENGTLRIADFGCAIQFPPGPLRDSGLLRDTEGAYSFLAPECIDVKGGQYSGYIADIWAAGVTLYTWVFGQVPFYRESPEPLYEAIRSEPLDLGHALSLELTDLLSRLLEKDPSKRILLEECLQHPWLADVPPPEIPTSAS